MEPDDLIARLEEGKVYRAAQAQQALGHFFSKQNLAALREIALRRTADRLNRTARKQHPEGFLNPSDHILVCLSSAPSNAKVIRTAARMAEAFQGDFTALFVETPDTRELSGENRKRLRANLKLAEDLGARIATVYGDDPAAQIADYSRTSGVTKIVLGRTNHRRRRGWWNKKALVDRLTELAPNLDVYIIPDRQPAYRPKWKIAPSELSFSWKDTGKMLGILAAATLLGELFSRLGLRRDQYCHRLYSGGASHRHLDRGPPLWHSLLAAQCTYLQLFLYGALFQLGCSSQLCDHLFYHVPLQLSYQLSDHPDQDAGQDGGTEKLQH